MRPTWSFQSPADFQLYVAITEQTAKTHPICIATEKQQFIASKGTFTAQQFLNLDFLNYD